MIEDDTNSVWNSSAVILPVTVSDPVIIASPFTSSLAFGLVVPIPTLPL